MRDGLSICGGRTERARRSSSWDLTQGLCLGPYDGPRAWAGEEIISKGVLHR